MHQRRAAQGCPGFVALKVYRIDYRQMVRRTAETRGVVLTWEGRPFPTYYASTCGAHMTRPEDSGLDPGRASEPLRGVQGRHCTTSKYYRWTARLTEREIVAALCKAKRPVSGPIHYIGITCAGETDRGRVPAAP